MSDNSNGLQDTPQEPLGAAVPDFELSGEDLGGEDSEGSQNAVYGDVGEFDESAYDDEKPSTSVDSYFDDDVILAGDDSVLKKEDDLMIFQQMENVVSWQVVNFLNENGKARGKRSLRNEPPILQISSSDGATAEFVVTNELSASLEKVFGDIRKSYHGIDVAEAKVPTFSQEGVKLKLGAMVDWVSVNRFKAAMLAVVIVLLFVSAIIYS